MAVKANDSISYNYLEVGLSKTDSKFQSFFDDRYGEFFNASFNLSDRFYGGGFLHHKGSSSFSGFSGSYGLFLGFHTDISARTDFYTQLNTSRIDFRGFDSNEYGLLFGTRTAFNDHFELITKVGYRYTHAMNEGNLEAGLKGVFNFNEKHAVFVEYDTLDYDVNLREYKLGYRFSF